ncbi:uncharacterized protein METZ01_LOCUS485417, partial [marine metagenome]
VRTGAREGRETRPTTAQHLTSSGCIDGPRPDAWVEPVPS